MVLQCLIDAIGDTHVSCAEETVRAVHGALQFYQLVRPPASLRTQIQPGICPEEMHNIHRAFQCCIHAHLNSQCSNQFPKSRLKWRCILTSCERHLLPNYHV